jgi:hypothetical protein
MASRANGDRLYQPSSQTADTPVLSAESIWVAGLLCIDALTIPFPNRPWNDNRDRHNKLRDKIGDAPAILCVAARMRSQTTKGIEHDWPQVHFVLANSCRPGDSRTHPSVIRIRGHSPVMYPPDEHTSVIEDDALVLVSLEGS